METGGASFEHWQLQSASAPWPDPLVCAARNTEREKREKGKEIACVYYCTCSGLSNFYTWTLKLRFIAMERLSGY